MYMVPGNLTITLAWSWHGHGNEGKENAIWLDGLDIPLFKSLPVDFTEHHEEEFGTVTHDSKAVRGEDSTEMKFLGKIMRARLDQIGRDHAIAEYTLRDGKSILTIIGAYVHRILAASHRHHSRIQQALYFRYMAEVAGQRSPPEIRRTS